MLNAIKLIFLKEVTEARRDRRSWITVLLISIVMPLSPLIGLMAASSTLDEAQTTVYAVSGGDQAPALLRYMQAQGLKTTDTLEDDGVQLIIPADYRQKLATGHLPTLTIRGDVSDNPEIVTTLVETLKEYAEELGRSRLMARGIMPLVIVPYRIDVEDTGDVTFLTRFLAPLLIFMFLMVPIYALMPTGIDCTAGERERHGLFPLLLQPVPALAIPLGKFLTLVLCGMISLAIGTVVGFIAFANVPIDGMKIGFDLSIGSWLKFQVIALPTVMLLSALIMGFASFAKTFKEGQTYVGIFSLVPLTFVGVGFILDEAWRPFIPFWAETKVLSGVLSGEAINWGPWFLTLVGYALVISLCLVWMSRSIRRQALEG